GSELLSVDVAAKKGGGVAVRAASARVVDVNVTGSDSAAIAIACASACSGGTVAIEDSTFTKSRHGLSASGAHVVMKNGRIAENGGTSLTGGLGVVAFGGARFEAEGTRIEKNDSIGVFLDGNGTQALLTRVAVTENGERG